jgi:hypothetical protein
VALRGSADDKGVSTLGSVKSDVETPARFRLPNPQLPDTRLAKVPLAVLVGRDCAGGTMVGVELPWDETSDIESLR